MVNKVLRELLDDPNLIQKASLVDEEFFLFEFSTIGRISSKTLFEDLEKRVSLIEGPTEEEERYAT